MQWKCYRSKVKALHFNENETITITERRSDDKQIRQSYKTWINVIILLCVKIIAFVSFLSVLFHIHSFTGLFKALPNKSIHSIGIMLLMAPIQCFPFGFRGEAGWACLAAQTQLNRTQIEKSIVHFSNVSAIILHTLCGTRLNLNSYLNETGCLCTLEKFSTACCCCHSAAFDIFRQFCFAYSVRFVEKS